MQMPSALLSSKSCSPDQSSMNGIRSVLGN
jgi:hypothetical protein